MGYTDNRNELRARESESGGDLTDIQNPSGILMDGKSEVVLLVHGYNNKVEDAADSYNSFIDNVNKKTLRPLLSNDPQKGNLPVFKLFWPGDWDVNDIVSSASYPWMVRRAPKVADVLEKYLNTLNGPGGQPMQIHVVAHSLGCRVTLDLISLLRSRPQSGNHKIVSFTLMAAAVPEYMLSDGDIFSFLPEPDKKSQVLVSRKDTVLHWAFPPGQTAAGEGFFPTAVGRFGLPNIWERSTDFTKKGSSGYGHSNYWSGDESAAEVAAFLGGTIAAIPEQNINSNTLPSSNSIPENKIGTRTIESRSVSV